MSPDKAETVADLLRDPVPPGELRILWCLTCGAVTGIKTPDGAVTGDPDKHHEWHAKKKGRFRR